MASAAVMEINKRTKRGSDLIDWREGKSDI